MLSTPPHRPNGVRTSAQMNASVTPRVYGRLASGPVQIALRINGSAHTVDVPRNATLLSVLRDDLGLTGTRYGCGIGRCGSCFVMANGQAIASGLLSAEPGSRRGTPPVEGLTGI